MPVYNSGSVRIRVGSSTVVGSSTDFLNYASVGNVFKLVGDVHSHEISSITSATKLTLTTRYMDINYIISRTNEKSASIGAATNIYSGTLNNTPVIQNYVVLNASRETFTDDGAGVLTGDEGGSGTIGYDDGSWSVILGTTLTATRNLVASYFSGDTLNSQPYQIVRDYTTNYEFPEISAVDLNQEYIITKALRLIDTKLYGGRKRKVTLTATNYTATKTNYMIIGAGNATPITITLPTTGVKNRGLEIFIVNRSSTFTLTASVNNTSDTIEGDATATLPNQYDKQRFYCVATNLWIKEEV